MHGLILATIEPSTIVSYNIGLLILALGIVLVVKHMKENKASGELDRFIKEITEILRQEITSFILKIDFHAIVTEQASIADAEIELVNQLYDKFWELVVRHLDEVYADEPIYIMMKKNLTPEFVRSVADVIINSEAVQNLISDKISEEAAEDDADELEAEYEKLNEEIENDTLAGGETVPEIDLEKEFPDKEPLIPPSDTMEDDVEVVGEETEEVPLAELTEEIASDDDEE